MRNRIRVSLLCVCGPLVAGVAVADTLELKSGKVVEGKYLGGTQAILQFQGIRPRHACQKQPPGT